MKGMQAIKRGSGFRGVVSYALENDNGEKLGQVIGGNMSGTTLSELSKEFGVTRKIRPEVKRPVWHNSLRLPEGEKISDEKWVEMGDDYMSRMGFSDKHPRVYVLHDDAKGQHLHIVASRISLSGELYLGKNENLISTRHIQALEKDYQLTITKGPEIVNGKIVMPDLSRPKAGEVGKFERTGEVPERFALAALIDTAIADKPTAKAFAERLVLSGIEVRANFSKSSLNGFSFSLNGVPFKGSQIGKKYTGKALLERGLNYEQSRDYAYLSALSSAAKKPGVGNGVAANVGAPGSPKNPGIDGGNAKNSDRIRGTNGAGAGSTERSDSADNAERAGLGYSAEFSDSESRDANPKNDRNAGPSGESAEAIAGAETAANKPPFDNGFGVPRADLGGDNGVDTAAISVGVEIADAGLILTGDKGTDELLRAAHHARLKTARENLNEGRKQWEIGAQVLKKALADFSRPYVSLLYSTAQIGRDVAAYRIAQITDFAAAMGVKTLAIVCTKAGKKPVKAALNINTINTSTALKSIAILSARGYKIGVEPAKNSGLILLKNLDAQALETLETAGFGAAVAVDFAGKREAWINCGQGVNEGERAALTQRLGALVEVVPGAVSVGQLPGFSGASTVPLTTAIAPAAAAMLLDIKAEIFEAKAATQLAKNAVEFAVLDKPLRDFLQSPGLNMAMQLSDTQEISKPLFSLPIKPKPENKMRNITKEPEGPSFG